MDRIMRRLIDFPCEGETLAATLDEAAGTSGLLIVSGGNEIRIGAHRGMALLAERVSAAGHPVFRFDRRGIGDSSGTNRGYRHSAPDIAAALAAFREQAPQVERVVAFGNCDAASALVLGQAGFGFDALLLANPWLDRDDEVDALPQAAAIRARYAEKLKDPREWLRLLRGGVDLSKLRSGLTKVFNSGSSEPATSDIVDALRDTPRTTLLLAMRDNTAIAFEDMWKRQPIADRDRIATHRLDSASHSFASETDKSWLLNRVLEALGSTA